MDVNLVLGATMPEVQDVLHSRLTEPTGVLTVTAFHIPEADVIQSFIHLFYLQPFVKCLLCATQQAGVWEQTG